MGENYEINEIDRSPTIMLVDDNDANIQLAASILKRNNYNLILAYGGEEALDILEDKSADLILLDVMMPDIDGYEVCKRLKENDNTKDIPVILLTALRKHESLVKGFSLGAIDYISKPFNKDELLARVKNHLDLKFSRDFIIEQNAKLDLLNQENKALLKITAHDLKSPLQGIYGLLDIIEINLRSGEFDVNEILENIELSKKAALQAEKIIRDILDLNNLENGKLGLNNTNVNLNELLNRLIRNYNLKATNKNINLMFDSNIKNETIKIDEDKIYRIFDNLLSNALKFSDYNTNVYVKAFEEETFFKINIIDEGPGITDEDKTKLFKKFVKLSNSPTGNETSSGLGLSIVKQFADLMGIEVNFKTEVGKGTEFFIIINKDSNG